ncbi:sulfotransferase family protein [Aquirufa ecclesiirivi]|uniref:sulfotransferase family protein n=1 Tax=Aquirufa ecclesiirivi TaxID=2715124 RepID=UPI0023D89522|nr:sulfotransferase [Aquirufa ecclesiirivi]MDF0692481.1 sulfotransferase [Aquirufa ecclesiirivi]
MNKDSNMLLVTGLARSGTTLLSECLDHHPNIMCIADPMNEFFKGFMRYAYYLVENEKKDVGYPIDHFFFSGSKEVSKFIDETDFNHPIPPYLKEEILARIAIRDGEYCPEIIEPLAHCQATTFDGLFLEILQLLYVAYGQPGTTIFGVKTAWCEQLLKPLARTFPNMKFVNILRDPRAVIASNYQDEGSRFPIFFNIRDWRKSVYYHWKFENDDTLMKDRFVGVKYEDIISDPEKTLQKITDLLGLEYSTDMVNKGFKKPNSSYQVSEEAKGIVSDSKDKWKKVLPAEIILQTEIYCGAEMDILKYHLLNEKLDLDFNAMVDLKDNAFESLSGWCQDLVINKANYEGPWHEYQIHLEAVRLILLRGSVDQYDRSFVADFFYQHAYFMWLKQQGKSLI